MQSEALMVLLLVLLRSRAAAPHTGEAAPLAAALPQKAQTTSDYLPSFRVGGSPVDSSQGSFFTVLSVTTAETCRWYGSNFGGRPPTPLQLSKKLLEKARQFREPLPVFF